MKTLKKIKDGLSPEVRSKTDLRSKELTDQINSTVAVPEDQLEILRDEVTMTALRETVTRQKSGERGLSRKEVVDRVREK